jgi:hypothetical protein
MTGTGTQTEGTGTQANRVTDRQGHRWTGKGIQTDTDMDTDTNIDKFNGQLTKNTVRALKALSFKEFYKIEF